MSNQVVIIGDNEVPLITEGTIIENKKGIYILSYFVPNDPHNFYKINLYTGQMSKFDSGDGYEFIGNDVRMEIQINK